MKIYTENTVLISEVIKNIYTVVGHDLRDCKKVELELRANVGVYKNLLDDIWDEIYGQLDSEESKSIFKKIVRLVYFRSFREYLKHETIISFNRFIL
ncbi:hypothetical protein NG774_11820 [Aliarcobacter cryaerophilus]|uniref:hypothetical protein n=1 Tax=Aliarcobacter cryaerophilus TaxID=28198 RepID=UPI003DA65FA8